MSVVTRIPFKQGKVVTNIHNKILMMIARSRLHKETIISHGSHDERQFYKCN